MFDLGVVPVFDLEMVPVFDWDGSCVRCAGGSWTPGTTSGDLLVRNPSMLVPVVPGSCVRLGNTSKANTSWEPAGWKSDLKSQSGP